MVAQTFDGPPCTTPMAGAVLVRCRLLDVAQAAAGDPGATPATTSLSTTAEYLTCTLPVPSTACRHVNSPPKRTQKWPSPAFPVLPALDPRDAQRKSTGQRPCLNTTICILPSLSLSRAPAQQLHPRALSFATPVVSHDSIPSQWQLSARICSAPSTSSRTWSSTPLATTPWICHKL